MTKVIRRILPPLALGGMMVALALAGLAQSGIPVAATPTTAASTPAQALYLQLRSVGLDGSRVFHARNLSFNRGPIEISLDDGTIAFTQDVEGRVTGAFFSGDGEVLLMPPNQVERASMALFTGAAILEEKFTTAYFRFNDDTYAELLPQLLPSEGGAEFAQEWNDTAHNLASDDALRLLVTLSRFLPAAGQASEEGSSSAAVKGDHFLHAHVQGERLGGFDLLYDSMATEQVRVGQLASAQGELFYDVWASFSTTARPSRGDPSAKDDSDDDLLRNIKVSSYKINAEVKPPTELDVDATLQVEVKRSGERALLFELSRVLEIKEVTADGKDVEFIHNPSLEGTILAREGNDMVAVVFPVPLQAGERIALRFIYQGEVLSAAGSGLLYVGARGTWYPNLGLSPAMFDLQFRYPTGWTLVATGVRSKPTAGAEDKADDGEQTSRWVSEKPIPLAGFNLGKYNRAEAHAGKVEVDTYAASGVEDTFPQGAPATVIQSVPGLITLPSQTHISAPPPPPSPARTAQMVADDSAAAVRFFSSRFGPYPYQTLELTQMPGRMSQGWPGLIFLSSYAFLTPEEKENLHMSPVDSTRAHGVVAHETAHQWWGDLVQWDSYRDQWIVEALAEYSSLMFLESQSPAKFRDVMDYYRYNLLSKNKDGQPLTEDGPVTLGLRLSNSHFPSGYESISYGRGVWLFHMLRTMMLAAEQTRRAHAPGDDSEEPFVRALRKLREQYEGKSISTTSLLRVFADQLPPSLWYEGRKSLDWFSEGWVNGTAVPHLELREVKYADEHKATLVSGTIVQTDAPDDLVTSVPIYGTVGGKSVLLGQVFADGAETQFHLTAPEGTRKIALDPNHTLLTRTR